MDAGRGLVPRRRERALDLDGHRALPGLINSHDHLSLNLLPHLGEPPYPSLYRFAEEIYRPDRSPIREVERVSIWDRLAWGGYKNLISGVTTVVHHDPLPRTFFLRDFPVGVLKRYSWSHSLRFGDPATSFNASKHRPFIIHAAEGIDDECHTEIDRLDDLGILGSGTVIVHGIALSAPQRQRLAETGTSVVWCPASNLRLYGRTAPIAELKGHTPLALGTDSTLTGSPTLLDELRAAAATSLATADELLSMVTADSARIFGLRGRGKIKEGAFADLTVLPEAGKGAGETLMAARPADLALVMVEGRTSLALPELAEQLGLGAANGSVDGAKRWLAGDPARLKQRIRTVAGRETLQRNPVWGMLASC